MKATVKSAPEGRGVIVVGVDGSASSRRALAWAARQAQLTGAPLEPAVVWEWPISFGWGLALPDDYDANEDMRAVLDAAAAEVVESRPDLVVNGTVVEGHPAPYLVDRSKGADLLVVGSRGHGAFTGMLLGSVSEYCAAHARCPVVVHREEPAESQGTVVVGVDGSPRSLAALEWAAGQADLTRATLELVTVWDWPSTYGWGWALVPPAGYDFAGDVRSNLDKVVADLAVTHPRVTVSSRVLQGHPAAGLVELSNHADLLVVGSRGHGEFVGMLLGSVSEHCVSHAHCPVVVHRGD